MFGTNLLRSARHLPIRLIERSSLAVTVRHPGPSPLTPDLSTLCPPYPLSNPWQGLSTMSGDMPSGVVLGIGNPLLDITVSADKSFLDRYGLAANNAVIAEEHHLPMYDEMMQKFTPHYIAGGATQNSIRVAQWLLQTPQATTFFGCVGNDERGKILHERGTETGVNTRFQVTDKLPTGVCGAVITGVDRSLVAHLGAANFFSHEFLEQPENWALVKDAHVFYIGGFVFPVCSQAIFDIGRHASEQNKILVMNLSAPFLCKYYADTELDIMPYVDVLFGNETEAATFCELRGIEAADISEMALKTSELPKSNKKRHRTVVFTQGQDPVIIAKDGQVRSYPIPPVKKEEIKDTNGCGDAFVGGFLSQLVKEQPVDECLRCGQYAASVVIRHWGCTFPPQPDFQ